MTTCCSRRTQAGEFSNLFQVKRQTLIGPSWPGQLCEARKAGRRLAFRRRPDGSYSSRLLLLVRRDLGHENNQLDLDWRKRAQNDFQPVPSLIRSDEICAFQRTWRHGRAEFSIISTIKAGRAAQICRAERRPPRRPDSSSRITITRNWRFDSQSRCRCARRLPPGQAIAAQRRPRSFGPDGGGCFLFARRET